MGKRFASSVVTSQIHQTAANDTITSIITSRSGCAVAASLKVTIVATNTRS